MYALHHEHQRDHAVVHFSGELSWDSATALIECIDTLIESYYYNDVELVVRSDGGLVAVLEHLSRAISRWRDSGARLRTRVIGSASSAAAVLVSLGDERIAEPESRLLYHFSRVLGAGAITANASAHLHGELMRIDERIVALVVERTMRERDAAPPPHQAEPSDCQVLERLVEVTTRRRRPSRRSRPVEQLAGTLGRAIDEAVRSGDRDTLARIYRALAETEIFISPALAQTLRLIDRIGDDPPGAPEARPAGTPGLTIPEWRTLYPPIGEIPREVITRHTLILGETGSGKTVSIILPVAAALARAPHERLGGALVIDPKRDLASVLKRLAPQRVRHITAETAVLNLMTGERWRLDADLAAGRWTCAATRILRRVRSFVPGSPLRVLDAHPIDNANEEFFSQEGTRLLCDILAFILMVTSADAPSPSAWAKADMCDVEGAKSDYPDQWMKTLVERAEGQGDVMRGPNALALCAWALDGPLALPITARILETQELNAPTWLFARLARLAMPVWGGAPGEGRDLLLRVLTTWKAQAAIERQYAGVIATARTACAEFASPTLARSLYFGCEPGFRAAHAEAVDFGALVSREADGRIVLFQPQRDGLDGLMAMALKALFFEAVLSDPDRVRGVADTPLVAYIADEFHRFVTSDAVHGEQSFLDTCRSFGAFCVLATQSASSIEHALSLGGGSAKTNEAALSILWTNTATKVFFRSTDTETARRVAELCPQRPGWSTVTEVRPLAALAPGECYAALADGGFARRRLVPFTLDVERMRSRPSSGIEVD